MLQRDSGVPVGINIDLVDFEIKGEGVLISGTSLGIYVDGTGELVLDASTNYIEI